MEKRIIPVTLGNDKLRPIISEIIETNNVFDNLEFQLTDKNDLNKNIFVKVRSTGNLLEAKVDLYGENNAKVNLIYPEDGISPGQACVFYSKDNYGDKLLGGGWIVS